MDVGLMNTRVTIQKEIVTQDDWGGVIRAWTDVATVSADFRHKSGSETIKGDAPVSTVRASVRIRWRTDVDAGMRVKVGDALYSISAVLPDLQGRVFVDLVCERTV